MHTVHSPLQWFQMNLQLMLAYVEEIKSSRQAKKHIFELFTEM